MGTVGRQFGLPSGLLGRLAGRVMARNNAGLNRSLVTEVAALVPSPRVVAELGFGPGIGLAALLSAFPHAHVLGADPSSAVTGQATARNRAAVETGRLRLLRGEVSVLSPYAPIDLVVAVHVLYFWHDPVRELHAVAELLSPVGHLALGYQLRQHMPPVARRDFPAEGHRLYESDDQVVELLRPAGLEVRQQLVIGSAENPEGRLLLACRR